MSSAKIQYPVAQTAPTSVVWPVPASKSGARRSPRGAMPLLAGIFSRPRTRSPQRSLDAIVADALNALIDHPWSEPALSVWRTRSGTAYVRCAIAGRDMLLTADQARQVATSLFDDQAFAGAAGLAADLFVLADMTDPQVITAEPLQ
ncbi:hypothetical protein [Brevundimonas sp.]|uniref:hypothetical protein n=1 Tax=Brevundimonas sp. TaxID=1871086 RepID=UPI0028A211F5|nr:hypothetical protein [Brevundimonas sp.]